MATLGSQNLGCGSAFWTNCLNRRTVAEYITGEVSQWTRSPVKATHLMPGNVWWTLLFGDAAMFRAVCRRMKPAWACAVPGDRVGFVCALDHTGATVLIEFVSAA